MLRLAHKNLILWDKVLFLVKETYRITGSFPSNEKFILTSQIRRAVISVASNIAEGASRSSRKERKRFYEISRSSLVELDTQIELSLVLDFITIKDIEVFNESINENFAMISAMIKNT